MWSGQDDRWLILGSTFFLLFLFCGVDGRITFQLISFVIDSLLHSVFVAGGWDISFVAIAVGSRLFHCYYFWDFAIATLTYHNNAICKAENYLKYRVETTINSINSEACSRQLKIFLLLPPKTEKSEVVVSFFIFFEKCASYSDWLDAILFTLIGIRWTHSKEIDICIPVFSPRSCNRAFKSLESIWPWIINRSYVNNVYLCKWSLRTSNF